MIKPPKRRKISLLGLPKGSSLGKDEELISWHGDTLVTYYRLEFSKSKDNWANPKYRFATSGTSLVVKGVQPDRYHLRLGAFSEVSGRWEYTDPLAVVVK